jgi:hypothetical protein
MRKNKVLVLSTVTLLLGGFALLKAQQLVQNKMAQEELKQIQTTKIIYFNPDIYPDLEEIKEPTNYAFFSTITDLLSENKSTLLKPDQTISFENTDQETIREYCKNNEADFAVVPRIKYFKVGLGKFVFSSQVIVSMKLYNADGEFLSESQYDTYKKNKKLLGSAENFVKIGTKGAWKEILKTIKSQKYAPTSSKSQKDL